MIDPNYNRYQNVYTGQDENSPAYDDYFGQNVSKPYIRGLTTRMPQPMLGNLTETSLYPLQSSLATPQLNPGIEQMPQGYAKGGMIKQSKTKKKDTNNPYPSLAEMIRQQGKGEDSILAHINPLEAMLLEQMGGSGTINPKTGLPQFGFLKSLGRGIRSVVSPITLLPKHVRSVTNRNPRTGAPISASATGQEMVPYVEQSTANSMVPRTGTNNEELVEKLRNQMFMDQARLANTNYVPYRGETVAPLSQATIRAQNLKNQWSQKPAPYANKIATVLKGNPQGFSPEQQENLLNMIRRGSTSEDMVSQRMAKQFGHNYGYEPEREVRLKEKIGKDTNRSITNSRANLKNLSDQLQALEGNRRTNMVNAFHGAGRAKEGRRNALTNQLEEFGNLERNYRNLKNQAGRDAFNEELNAPQKKMAIAGQALHELTPYISGAHEEMHPGRAAAHNAQLQKIMNFYNSPHLNYPGKRVVDIEPETKRGYELTGNMNPKYRDRFYNERKAMEKEFLGNKNIAGQTYDRIPENLEPVMANLDYLTKQQLKQEAREISGRHRRMGTYGSGVHKAETEKASRNILRRFQAERENALSGVARNQSELVNQTERNALNRYAQLAGLGAKEFTDTLATHKNLVNSGNRQWGVKQEAENARLQNWYDQLKSELPQRQLIGQNT